MDEISKVKKIDPKVSIIMLTYNRERYIKIAIKSVLKQSYQNWELIVIDDGSTDNTSEVIAGLNDSRIIYIQHKDNAGLFARRKESLKYATGKYTAILDSDDIWSSPEKLSRQVIFLETNTEHVLIGTNTRVIDENGNFVHEVKFATSDNEIRKKILIRNQYTHSAVLIKTSALKMTPGYIPTLAEDLNLFLELGKLGKIANLKETLTSHRVHTNSANDYGPLMARAVVRIVKNHKQYYPNSWIGVYAAYTRLLLSQIRR